MDAAMGAGVLHPESAAARFRLTRHQPGADLARFVDFYWMVRWDLTGQAPYEQAILPHPNVNLAFEADQAPKAAVYGSTPRSSRGGCQGRERHSGSGSGREVSGRFATRRFLL